VPVLLDFNGRGATDRFNSWFGLIDTLKVPDLLESFNKSVVVLLN
jgi:hypothetical protein